MESIYSFNIIFPDRRVILLKADVLSSLTHSAENIAELVVNIMEEYGPKRFTGHLHTLPFTRSSTSPEFIFIYMDVSVTRDLLATLLSASLAHALVKSLEFSASHDYLTQLVCRKIVHISTGPLFVLTWPLFSAAQTARICAAAVPLSNAFRLMLIAIGTMDSKATIKAVSRGGSRQELLRGPLLYIGIVTAVTLLFWRESPVGLMVLSLMCGGDGLADIVGRRYGSARLPFNHSKSWLGSLAMFTGGAVMSMVYIALFHSMGTQLTFYIFVMKCSIHTCASFEAGLALELPY
ncbi:hypothetical protein WJX77_010053 [Trebouxia sp. C0004]